MRVKVPMVIQHLAGKVPLAAGVATVGALSLVTSAGASIPDGAGGIHGCPSGTVLLGGGVTLLDLTGLGTASALPVVVSSGPVSSLEWDTVVSNPDPVGHTYGVWAICAQAG